MTPVLFKQYKPKSDLMIAGLHVYRSQLEGALKMAKKTYLVRLPKSTRVVRRKLAAQPSPDEFAMVQAKVNEVSDQFADQLISTFEVKLGSRRDAIWKVFLTVVRVLGAQQ